MLRIWSEEKSNGHRGLRLRLEGQLQGPWVAELERAAAEARAHGFALTLDLAGVDFVDTRGVALLRDLQSLAIRLENCSPFTAEQLRS